MNHMPLFEFKFVKIKQNEIFSSSVAADTFQMFTSQVQLLATTRDHTDIKYFHHHKKLYWVALLSQDGEDYIFLVHGCMPSTKHMLNM